MRITAKFICKEGCLNIKFNGNCVPGKWLEDATDELRWFLKSYLGTNKCDVKFRMWSTDATDDAITFSVDTDVEKSFEDLSGALFRQFRGNELFRLKQEDIDNFTYSNNDYWIKLIDEIEIEEYMRWLYPMLDGVKVQEV